MSAQSFKLLKSMPSKPKSAVIARAHSFGVEAPELTQTQKQSRGILSARDRLLFIPSLIKL